MPTEPEPPVPKSPHLGRKSPPVMVRNASTPRTGGTTLACLVPHALSGGWTAPTATSTPTLRYRRCFHRAGEAARPPCCSATDDAARGSLSGPQGGRRDNGLGMSSLQVVVESRPSATTRLLPHTSLLLVAVVGLAGCWKGPLVFRPGPLADRVRVVDAFVRGPLPVPALINRRLF